MANHDTVSFGNRNANSQIDGATGLVYGAFQPQASAAYVMGMAGFGYWDNQQTRTIWATPSDRDAGRVSVGLDIATTKTMTVHPNLNGEVGTSTSSYGGQVGVQWKW